MSAQDNKFREDDKAIENNNSREDNTSGEHNTSGEDKEAIKDNVTYITVRLLYLKISFITGDSKYVRYTSSVEIN